jgi:hypothetical protein
MGQGPDKVSLSSEAQLDRWKQFISQWEEALQEKETVVLGDINIDWLCCCTEDPPACPNKAAKWRSAKPLLDELNRRITPNGPAQLVPIGPTKNLERHYNRVVVWSVVWSVVRSVATLVITNSSHSSDQAR